MPATLPWERCDDLTFEKEVLPTGRLVRWAGDDREVQHINVHRAFLDKAVAHFKKFKEVGVRVPLFKTHEEDPDNDRGTVEDLFIKQNAKGFDSLFARIKFHDVAARDLGLNNDVSALCPPVFVDGKGNRYDYPLRHVALTSKPIVPGLQKFEPVMLSFSTESGLCLAEPPISPPPGTNDNLPKDNTMDQAKWNQLLAMLGITPTSESTPDDQLDLVIAEVKSLTGDSGAGAGAGAGDGAAGGGAPPVALSHISPVMVKQMITARRSILNGLMLGETPKLTPAAAKKLEDRFCTEVSVKADLELSEGNGETEFDRTIEMLNELAPTPGALKASGRKIIKLGQGDDEPATVKNARKRAEAAKVSR